MTTPGNTDPQYEARKEKARLRNEEMSKSGRDIGPLPEVVSPERKELGKPCLRTFCETYFPGTFSLNWSKDHLELLKKIQAAVLLGGLFAFALPRGSGKTSISERGCLWAILYGHRSFPVLIGSDEAAAMSMLDSMKNELSGNEMLLEDFPEAVFPIHCLEGISHRTNGQLLNGKRTQMRWTGKAIIMPTVEGSPSSGAIFWVAGITGRIRGMKLTRPDGKTVRPDFVIVDDPQTNESARSPSQVQNRIQILKGDVLGLAGPGEKIPVLMPCTVIYPDDLADKMLNREKNPRWQGQRTKLIYKFPDDEDLWEEYDTLVSNAYQSGMEPEAVSDVSREFYLEHQESLEKGAEVAWAERFNEDEVNAIHHAMNLYLRDRYSFFAEYQNDPKPIDYGQESQLTVEEVQAKINGLNRYQVPIGATHLNAFIDVQKNALYYVIMAWEENFTGYVVDYGTYPEQKRQFFKMRDIRDTLAVRAPGAGMEASIYAGLEELTNALLSKSFSQDGGTEIRISQCVIDANWGLSTDTVYSFCNRSAHSAVLTPSHGRFIGASSQPLSTYKKKPGEKVGNNWRITNVSGKRQVKHILYDTNFWKSFVQARLAVRMGDPGCVSIFGNKPEVHHLFAEHMYAEYSVKTHGRGREVNEWKIRPEQFDNHWFDCVVGCAVAASVDGSKLPTEFEPSNRKRKKVSPSQMQRQKRKERGE